MAVYKIFPYKDASIYSSFPAMNSGMDAISEITNALTSDGDPSVSRFLTQFDSIEINDIINNKISQSQWDVKYNLFVATAQGIAAEYISETYPVAQDWNNGTGEYLNSPQTTDGISWDFSSYSGSNPWIISGSIGTELYTSSYNPNFTSQGGGNWFYSGSGISSYTVTQSFDLRSNKDLSISVKTIVSKWYSGSIPNYGFITKWDDSLEFNPSQYVQPIIKYYSVDTNTIYPPQLEFNWVDYSTVLTGSQISNIVSTSNLKLAINENPGVFYPSSVNRFRINVSPLYPARTFQTTSYFTDLNYLPTSSYYAIKDLDTNEFVINFDTQYTQISSDNTSNYFDVYMNGLQPERYYTILLKTTIGGNTQVIDSNYNFKVING